jgi:hypothetical protein
VKLDRAVRRITIIVAASLTPAIGCKTFGRSVGPPAPSPTQRGIDEPPPLHTGGLDVLGTGPGQGPGSSPGSHGDPVAEAIATGVGMATIGVTAARTVNACAQVDASANCVRGPGPADNERDAGR